MQWRLRTPYLLLVCTFFVLDVRTWVISNYSAAMLWWLKCYLLWNKGGAMKALYSYSPLEDSWTLVIQLGCERASCGIAACNNKLFITGGRDDKNEVIATVLCWNPEAKKLTEECVLPRGVSHHGSVTLRKSYTHIRRITPGTATGWQMQPLQSYSHLRREKHFQDPFDQA